MTNDRALGQRFGPEPHQYDRYEGTSGDEFVAEVEAAFTVARDPVRASGGIGARPSFSRRARTCAHSVAAFLLLRVPPLSHSAGQRPPR